MEGGEARDPSRGLPTTRVGESAVRVFRVDLPRVILSEAKPEGQIALQIGSREKVKRKSYRKSFADPDLRSPLRGSTSETSLMFPSLRMTDKGGHRAERLRSGRTQ